MRTNQLFRTAAAAKTLKAGFFAAALFCSASVFAQVKIGMNPTAIGANNNLEVEASTMGRKTSIDKTTGKVTIADGSEGVDKVLTSDANGVATWQKVNTPNITQLPKGQVSGASVPLPVTNGSQTLSYSTLDFAEGGVSQVAQGIKVPIAGYYMVKSSTFFSNLGCTTNASLISISTSIIKNGVDLFPNGGTADDRITPRIDDNSSSDISWMLKLNADDVLTVKYYITITGGDPSCTTSLLNGKLQVIYQP